MYLNTLAITLSSVPIGEADVLLRVCSMEHGLLLLRQRSARRGASRLKVFKEQGVFADLHCWGRPGDESAAQILTGKILEVFQEPRRSLSGLRAMNEALVLMGQFLVAHDSQAVSKFLILLDFLARLEAGFYPQKGLAMFKLKMIDLSGWKFSTSDLASQFLDAKMRESCGYLEDGIFPCGTQRFDFERLHRVLDQYVEGLLVK